MLKLRDVFLVQTYLQVSLVDLDCKSIFNMLNSKILSDASQLTDEILVIIILLIFLKKMLESLFEDMLWPNGFRVRPSRYSQIRLLYTLAFSNNDLLKIDILVFLYWIFLIVICFKLVKVFKSFRHLVYLLFSFFEFI